MSVYKKLLKPFRRKTMSGVWYVYSISSMRLIFYNDVQDDINVILSHALKKASGKPMEDASEILYNAMDKIMEGDLEPDEDDLEEISASHRTNTGHGISARKS